MLVDRAGLAPALNRTGSKRGISGPRQYCDGEIGARFRNCASGAGRRVAGNARNGGMARAPNLAGPAVPGTDRDYNARLSIKPKSNLRTQHGRPPRHSARPEFIASAAGLGEGAGSTARPCRPAPSRAAHHDRPVNSQTRAGNAAGNTLTPALPVAQLALNSGLAE